MDKREASVICMAKLQKRLVLAELTVRKKKLFFIEKMRDLLFRPM